MMLDDWLMRNTPITKADSSKLSDLRYYLGVQLRFFRQVSGIKSAEVKYLEHMKLLQSKLIKIGVLDSCMDNEVRMIHRLIDTTIEMLENKLGI